MRLFRRPPRFNGVTMLAVGPNDRIIIETREQLSPMQVEEMRDYFARWVGIDRARTLVVHNATVKVLREMDPPPPPPVVLVSGDSA